MAWVFSSAWSALEETIGLTDDSQDRSARITLKGDGTQLLAQSLSLSVGNTQLLKLDLSGVLRLRIEVEIDGATCSSAGAIVAIGPPTLIH